MMIEVRPGVWVNKDRVTHVEVYGENAYPEGTLEDSKATGRVHFASTSVLTTLPHEALFNAFRDDIDFMSDDEAQAQWEARYQKMIIKANQHAIAEQQRQQAEAQRMMDAMKGQPLPKMELTDDGPHSRACGIYPHPHGPMCAADCYTCQGKPDGLETSQIDVQDASVDSHNHGYADACGVGCPAFISDMKEEPGLVIPAAAKLQPGDVIRIIEGGWELVEPEPQQRVKMLSPFTIDTDNRLHMEMIAGCLVYAGVSKNDQNYHLEVRAALKAAKEALDRGDEVPPAPEQAGHGYGHGHDQHGQHQVETGKAKTLTEAYDESVAVLFAKVAAGQNVTVEEMYVSNPYRNRDIKDDLPEMTDAEKELQKQSRAACLEAWPEAHSMGYNPSCCRFPKSCSIPDDPDKEPINTKKDIPMYGSREEDLGVEDWRPNHG